MNESFEEQARREKAPIQYRIYKGIKGNLGAMRLNLKRPYTSNDPRKAEGVLFLEMVPAIGPNVYDWDNQKMIMALSIVDIPKIILYLRSPGHKVFEDRGKLSLMHDKGAGTARKGQDIKTLEIQKPSDRNNFMFSMYEKANGSPRAKAAVTVSPEEAIVLGTLLQQAIPIILSWTEGPN